LKEGIQKYSRPELPYLAMREVERKNQRRLLKAPNCLLKTPRLSGKPKPKELKPKKKLERI
jgi:hypothetical protein